MTPDQSRDAAYLARALASTDKAWWRELDHADKLKWAAITAGAVGVAGLVFREAVHASLVQFLGALIVASFVAYMSSRER